MNSIPRLSTPTHTRLDAIPGAVPHPLKLPKLQVRPALQIRHGALPQ